MNISVEHVLMFALVVCVFYYLMGNCGCKEGYVDQKSFCENELKNCLCPNNLSQAQVQACLDKVDNMVVPDTGGEKCNDKARFPDWQVEKAISEGGGSWFGTAPKCEGDCPSGWTYCETSKTGDGGECWTGNKVRCANLS